MFTSKIIGSVRQALGYKKLVTDTVRRILVLGKWTTLNCGITMWTFEPVIATRIVHGNTVNATAARENFAKDITVMESLTMTTCSTTVVQNEMRGRCAGWLMKAVHEVGLGEPIMRDVQSMRILDHVCRLQESLQDVPPHHDA
ncbi:hypothetical protein FOPE_10837 [Fonsecaea pedrosoi]|nr:hypothetical protein FOPE_10837 [Fonsecaea pedrosoi]